MEGPPKDKTPKLEVIEGASQAEIDKKKAREAEIADAELEYMSSDPEADTFVFKEEEDDAGADAPANVNKPPTNT